MGLKNIISLRLSYQMLAHQGKGTKTVCSVDPNWLSAPVIMPAGMMFIKITKGS